MNLSDYCRFAAGWIAGRAVDDRMVEVCQKLQAVAVYMERYTDGGDETWQRIALIESKRADENYARLNKIRDVLREP